MSFLLYLYQAVGTIVLPALVIAAFFGIQVLCEKIASRIRPKP